MGRLLISEYILDPVRKLWSFRKLDNGMDIIPEDETSYSTQYQESYLKYVENEYCSKLRHLSAKKHSVWVEWLRQSGRGAFELSETSW